MILAKVKRVLTGVLVSGLIAVFLVSPAERAEALSGIDFDPGYMISDENFYTADAMTQGEIQDFLDAKIGTCQNSLCLNVLRIDTTTTTLSFGTCATYQGEANELASRMIYKVQQACAISAKVLLVTLQKEQGLVTSKAPTEAVLRKALGQGCPDTAQCDSAYYGFFMQVYSAARQFAWYGNPEGSHTSIKVGQSNAVRFHPSAACGSSAVVIRNRATAALYYYTPYQPNAAALANLGGTGDSCSSYGNRNFWVYYTDWFGSPNSGEVPIGGINLVAPDSGEIQIQGWAVDPDTADSVAVHVYIDGKGAAISTADDARPDVGRAFPGYGDKHGINLSVAASTGTHRVCVYAINLFGGRGNTELGCDSITIFNRSPIGGMNAFSSRFSGEVSVEGWTIDPDTSASLDVHLYVDGVGTATTLANINRPDVGRNVPGFGENHGIQVSFPVVAGPHNVCAYAINKERGGNALLGCQNVTVQSMSPFGGMNVVTGDRSITVQGWTIDPSTSDAITVHVYVDDVQLGAPTAGVRRPDIEQAFPGFGANHGIDFSTDVEPGLHNVCAYALNVGRGGNVLLGCQTVSVQDYSPFGGITVTPSANRATITGWTIDPDTMASIAVHTYMDGAGVAVSSANINRPDVGRAYPSSGPNHGIDISVSAAPGSHVICAYGINVGRGANKLLGCESITVPAS
ncbi:hypothetical protein [Cryobacterium luteum]|uniref:Hemagglutinin n=1 Tax=Cryobacterium luteum TaxID=1424661 RepID=A0A1H8KRA8_9MICO|nr:hypothetical protein [Cryobacterium luteum]TFB95042.1 hypothetical protein E3O10_00960 [Cryobacterium luteum]SEN95146.1 hypothetical protein SAMN05216281_12050 [Cryobacterium luteum]